MMAAKTALIIHDAWKLLSRKGRNFFFVANIVKFYSKKTGHKGWQGSFYCQLLCSLYDIVSIVITIKLDAMRTNPPMPLPVQRALAKLGDDIRTARLRHRIPTALMAARMMVTRTTLRKVEKGDAGVSMGIYATALFIVGMTSRLADLADIKNDHVGLQLDEERLPKRIRRSSNKK
mgnify:CR=1 FL=1